MYLARFRNRKQTKRSHDQLVAIIDPKACTLATFDDGHKKQPKNQVIVLNVAKSCIWHAFVTENKQKCVMTPQQ